jgi:hypothetical protein
MHIPTTAIPVEFEYNTKEKNQDKAIEIAARYGMAQNWQLVAIHWVKADDEGFHIFNIVYNP